MFENQMKKKSVATSGKYFAWVAAGDPDHRAGGEDAGEEQVEHRLVDAHVDAEDLQLDPGLQLELVLGREFLVLAVAAEDRVEQDGDPQPDEEGDDDLRLAAQALALAAARGARGRHDFFGSSNGRVSIWLVK